MVVREWWMLGWRVAVVAVGLGAVVLAFFVGVAFILNDSLFEGRIPWLSWPLTAGIAVFAGWLVYRGIASRRELVARLKGLEFDCPYCGERLPRWDGRFRSNPEEPDCVLWAGSPPEGRLKFLCDACRRTAWFYAWADRSVTHVDWLTEADGPDVQVLGANPEGTSIEE